MATALELVPHASAQPSTATASAIISSGRDGSVASAAASSVQPSAAASAGACRSRASITATSTSSRCKQQRRLYRLRPLLRRCTRARSGVHMQQGPSVRRLVPGLELMIAQYSPLRGYATHTHWCSALVRQRLGRVGGSAPAHAQRSPAQQSANRPSPRDDDACGIGRAIHGVVRKKQSQANTQTNKQTNKQTTNQPTKQTTNQKNKQKA